MDMDFIGFGDNRIAGETLTFGSLGARALYQGGLPGRTPGRDQYSGQLPDQRHNQNYMLRLFEDPDSRLAPFRPGCW